MRTGAHAALPAAAGAARVHPESGRWSAAARQCQRSKTRSSKGAVAEVLSAIYEVDFLGFSYGFRPGRNPHEALQALHTAVMTQYVNWVLDADIRSFFDSVDHEWLLRMVAHRVADPTSAAADPRDGCGPVCWRSQEWKETSRGDAARGGHQPAPGEHLPALRARSVGPAMAARRQARGRVVIVRYADDFVMGFQYEADAREMLVALGERLAKFELTLHEDKTRLIEFGRLVAEQRRARSNGDPRRFPFSASPTTARGAETGALWSSADRRPADQSEAAVGAGGAEAPHAHAGARAASLAMQRAARARSLLRAAEQLPRLDGFHDEVSASGFARCAGGASADLTWERFNALLDRFPLPPTRITHPREVSLACVG